MNYDLHLSLTMDEVISPSFYLRVNSVRLLNRSLTIATRTLAAKELSLIQRPSDKWDKLSRNNIEPWQSSLRTRSVLTLIGAAFRLAYWKNHRKETCSPKDIVSMQ